MDWTVPPVDRVDPPTDADERAQLEGFLDYHRQTLLQKCSGLSAEQLRRRSVQPSTLSLLGLLRHLGEVERSWFRRRLDGQDVEALYSTEADEDADFDDVDMAEVQADHATYLAEVEAARAAADRHRLDDTFVHERTGETLNLRWLYLHLLEEYARHNGHADLLRERIDGATGE
jgi:uncharacterized damage-inducible protein DinB